MIDFGVGKTPPLVLIKWVDSYGCGSTWGNIDEVPDIPHYCYSVGWLMKDGENLKVIVPHLSPKNDDTGADKYGCGDMSIPSISVIKITRLSEEPEDTDKRVVLPGEAFRTDKPKRKED